MAEELWGGETRKAVDNFPVSGEPIPREVARWLGRIKAAAARVNAELGLLDAGKAARIATSDAYSFAIDDSLEWRIFRSFIHAACQVRKPPSRLRARISSSCSNAVAVWPR